MVLFKQTLKDVEKFSWIDMSYDDFRGLCSEACEDEEVKCLYIDRPKEQCECEVCICNGRRPETFIE